MQQTYTLILSKYTSVARHLICSNTIIINVYFIGIITLITGIGGRLLVLMASVLALPTVFGNENLWPYFPIVAALPAFVHLLFAFLPKSPKFLYFSTQLSESPQLRREQSMKSIKFYHGDDVDSCKSKINHIN